MKKYSALASSTLFDEATFYEEFTRDLLNCKQEVYVESPYITVKRVKKLIPIFQKLLNRRVNIYVVTRDPKEHDEGMEYESEEAISYFERVGIQVLLCAGNHHRKLAILDRKILWEGSLNILSQTNSREIMRRIEGEEPAIEMFEFLKLNKIFN